MIQTPVLLTAFVKILVTLNTNATVLLAGLVSIVILKSLRTLVYQITHAKTALPAMLLVGYLSVVV